MINVRPANRNGILLENLRMGHTKIVQLSDLHLTTPGRRLFGASPRERLRLAIEVIRRDHGDAELCLLTGDLADADHEAAYRDLAGLISMLPMPACPMMGNHDDRTLLRATLPRLASLASGFIQYAVDTSAGRFLLLDTAEHGTASGFYCDERQEWLRRQLDAHDGPIFLAMHHPPLAVGIPSMDQFALRNAEEFWAVIAPHRHRIRHVFVGHVHRPIGGSWHGIPLSCTHSPNHQVALDLTALPALGAVPGCQEPPTFVVALIDEASVVVHHQAFLETGERFWI